MRSQSYEEPNVDWIRCGGSFLQLEQQILVQIRKECIRVPAGREARKETRLCSCLWRAGCWSEALARSYRATR